MRKAEKVYNCNIETNKKKRDLLKAKINIISSVRLLMIIGIIIVDYILYRNNKVNIAAVITIILICAFAFLVYYHDILFNKKKRAELFIKVNEDGLNRINNKLNNIDDGGSEYLDNNHPFINDLDVFGESSLFKIINTCATQGGRKELVDILKKSIILNKEEIYERQEAIRELSSKIDWRQKIIVEGKIEESKKGDINKFIEWNEKTSDKINYFSVVVALVFMFVTIFSIYAVVNNFLPQSFIMLDLIVNYVVVKIISKNLKNNMDIFESAKGDITAYSNILALIQEEKFECSYLKELPKNMTLNGVDCKSSMKKLSGIFSWISDNKYNAYYFIINILLFSDVFLELSIKKWRKNNGKYLRQWVNTMYKIDEMCSLSNLDFEHEGWCYPSIKENSFIEGINIGHPLLDRECVKNNFSIKDERKVALITGSNMSGKSTFLRTVGVNMILSYTGAPVCAEKFSCSIMNIYTCMRTKDNLEESISSFYAEILRIKLLIEAAKKGEQVFFLLDEIFKGTNSQDRHIGASVLIKQLIGYGGIGLVSTHDLELCDLEKEDPSIVNYNFREFYENDKIKFDYKLRKGKSETRNAVHLMKLAGIDISIDL